MGWFKRKPRPSGLQSERYAGKPLLILLENYVLSCISELAPEKEATLRTLTQQVFGGGEDWRATLRSTLGMEDSLDENLRGLWTRNQEIASQGNVTLSPEEFARMIVDENFAHLITG